MHYAERSNPMKSVIYKSRGEPAQVLEIADAEIPEPGPGQVRVRMLASPVNPSELASIRGTYVRRPPLPAVPGFEGVGVVDKAGSGLLGRFLVGRRVAALGGEQGNWREYTVVPARQAVPIPSKLPVEQAASFFVNPATAYLLTRRVLRIPPGGWLLQTAAGSALGRMIIALGKHYGFKTINVVRRSEQARELEELGADAVFVDSDDLASRVRDLTGGQGVLFALDPVGGTTAAAAFRCLAPAGRLVLYGSLSGAEASFSPREMVNYATRIEGFQLSGAMERLSIVGRLGVVRSIGKLASAGVLVSPVGKTYSLDQVREAVIAAEEPGLCGMVFLRFADGYQLRWPSLVSRL
jgi:NADPH:quinone reductase-like Zn-dependent oxidoreductase